MEKVSFHNRYGSLLLAMEVDAREHSGPALALKLRRDMRILQAVVIELLEPGRSAAGQQIETSG